MFLIDKLSNDLALKISSTLRLNKEKEEIIAYGAFNFIQTVWCILLVVLFGIIFNVALNAIIISFTISALRKYSGGAHSSSPNRCAVIGAIVSVGLALIVKYSNAFINFKWVAIIGSIIFIVSYYNIYRFAPVDSPSKPIVNEKTKKQMKRKSLFILNILGSFVLVLFISYFLVKFKSYLLIAACICVGVLWQVLTLTPKGYLVLSKIDAFLRCVTYKFGGENNGKL